MLKILYKSKNAVVIYKPHSVPSQPDQSGTPDALTLTSELLKKQGESTTLYPVHRLDRVVGGLMIIARTKAAAELLGNQVGGGGMEKDYLAVVDGTTEGGIFADYLIKEKMQNKATVTTSNKQGAKYAELYCTPLAVADTPRGKKTLLRVELKTGRFHQIRAQLSSRGNSITGDKKYLSRDPSARTPALFSYKLCLDLSGEKISELQLPPLDEYPWNLFSADDYIQKG